MSAAAVRPPIAGARLWSAVMDRAGQGRESAQCECTGQCGKHDGARCPQSHGEYRKRGGPVRLIAAPANLALDGTPAAARLGVDDLRAWCPRCHDGARPVTPRVALVPAQEGLF